MEKLKKMGMVIQCEAYDDVHVQKVSGVTIICLTQCNRVHTQLIRLLIVACGMFVHSSSMSVQSCWILAGTRTQSYAPIQSIPNMFIGYAVSMLAKNWDVFSFQELCTNPCNMGPCIIMLHSDLNHCLN